MVKKDTVIKVATSTPKKSTQKAVKAKSLVSEKSELSSTEKVSEVSETEKMEEIKKTNITGTTSSKTALEEIEEPVELEEFDKLNLPTFPAECYKNLPLFLSRAVAKGSTPEDKDILLLGAIVTISACLPNISGTYDQREVYPNLFLFVTAKASAGKGRLTLCRKLVEPIHKELLKLQRDEAEKYKGLLSLYRAASRSGSEVVTPQEPPQYALIIPANSSATSMFQILNDNDGVGLLFETEGDTLAQSFKSEHGNFSDGFRKAFHHEPISYARRKDREFVELEKPRLSAVLSGTPSQVSSLIPNAENGLFSRFIYYYMNIRPEWINVFAGDDGQNLDAYFDLLGKEFYPFHKLLKSTHPIHFKLSSNQQSIFNDFFAEEQMKLHCILGDDYLASIRRLGLITFRMGMILSALRIIETSNIEASMNCSDIDFNTAMSIVKVLIEHATYVFSQLPADRVYTAKGKTKKQYFLDALPPKFNRQGYLEVALKVNVADKTAQKYIGEFKKAGLLKHLDHNLYTK